MAATFLELSARLFSAKNTREKTKLSRDLSDLLSKEHGLTETLVGPLVMGVLSSVESLRPFRNEEFYYLHHRAYRDFDGVVRVAIGVAFLQHFEEVDPSLELRVLEELHAALVEQNLELLVNDLTANDVQVRNGEFGSVL